MPSLCRSYPLGCRGTVTCVLVPSVLVVLVGSLFCIGLSSCVVLLSTSLMVVLFWQSSGSVVPFFELLVCMLLIVTLSLTLFFIGV